MKITTDMIMGWGPCEEWPEERVRERIGDGMTAREILDAEDVPVEDRLWVVLRPEVLGKRGDLRMQIFCGRRFLGIFEREFPDDKRPRKVLRMKRKYLRGECLLDEMIAARCAAAARRAAAAWCAADAWCAVDAVCAAWWAVCDADAVRASILKAARRIVDEHAGP